MEEANLNNPVVPERSARVEGRIRSFDLRKGYGFITPDDYSRDVFVHQDAILGESNHHLATGDRVSYELAETPKGPRAANVQKL